MINGELIKILMRSKGITARQLAAKVGVSSSMMSFILSGLREPNIGTMVRIANELGCTIDELIAK
jgi:transcriptional regulator with XRE-family HTH domain